MIVLHHLNNSRSQRILWLLEELEIPYQIKKYERNPVTYLAPDELKGIHPLGKSPVITDGEKTIAESGAIIEYLLRKYGKESFSIPKDENKLNDFSYWLHFAEGSMMSPLLLRLVFDKIKSSKMPFIVKTIAKKISNRVLDSFVNPNIKANLNYVENHLKNNEWFLGHEISAADIQMSFPLEAGMSRIDHPQDYPNIHRFVQNIQKRKAYQAALEKGGRYDYAK
jgi:glutathione S-transferase